MASVAGKKSRVKFCATSGGTYLVIAGLKSSSPTIDGTNIDDSEFGVDWVQRIQGLKDFKLSISGARRAGDAGQDGIRDAFLAGTSIFIQFLPDNGTTAGAGIQQQMLVSKFAIDTSVEDKVNLSIELEGTGAITLV